MNSEIPTRPRVAIVIVTYNSSAVLNGCLRSIPGATKGLHITEVVVADNASTDETVRVTRESTALPIDVVQLGRNAGYAAGINAGFAALDEGAADAVLVLNPDCRLRPDSVRLLVEALRRPRCAIAVPKLVNPDGSLQPTLRRDPTVRGAIAEAFVGGKRAGTAGSAGELVTDPVRHDQAGEAAWATGAAMAISIAALRDIGPWDESFFLYSEETEFVLRARDHGWHLWYEPEAVVEHIGGDSGTDASLAALMAVNKVRLFLRRNRKPRALAYYLAIVFGHAVRAAAGRPAARASLAALALKSRRTRLPGPELPPAAPQLSVAERRR